MSMYKSMIFEVTQSLPGQIRRPTWVRYIVLTYAFWYTKIKAIIEGKSVKYLVVTFQNTYSTK
jgi:hypothetical protein